MYEEELRDEARSSRGRDGRHEHVALSYSATWVLSRAGVWVLTIVNDVDRCVRLREKRHGLGAWAASLLALSRDVQPVCGLMIMLRLDALES